MKQETIRERYPTLLEELRESAPFLALRGALLDPPARVHGLPLAAASWVLDELGRGLGRPVLLVAPHDREVALGRDASRLLSGEAGLLEFPAPPLSPYTAAERPLALEAAEVSALLAVSEGRCRGLVVPAPALLRRLPAPGSLPALELAVGAGGDPLELAERLLAFGFEPVDLVEEPGQFARRGGLVDLSIPGSGEGLRVEFWGDEIEGLRRFELSTQRTIGELHRCRVLALRMGASGEETPERLAAELRRQMRGKRLSEEARAQLELLETGRTFPGWRELLAVLPSRAASLFDWVPGALLAVEDPEATCRELERHLETLRAEAESTLRKGRLAPPVEAWLLPWEPIAERLRRAPVAIEPGPGPGSIDWQGGPAPALLGRLERLGTLLSARRERGERVLFVFPSAAAPSWRDRLAAAGIELGLDGCLAIEGEMGEGFSLGSLGLSVLTEAELLGRRRSFRSRSPQVRSGAAAFFGSFRELRVGDAVVHREHGIGKYRGLKRMQLPREGQPLSQGQGDAPAEEVEFLEIEYAGGSRLLVPLERLDLLERYGGIEGLEPRLDELGGTSWTRTRTRVARKVKDLAAELIRLYAARELAAAPALTGPSDLELQFEAAFPYEDTPDQAEAARAVLEDLARPRPMDRLLCGDVGFGKTEVAMRAAMRAVDCGYQVAVLAPTTLLADQHLDVFRERFEGFPVRIERFSRAVRGKELRNQLERLARGEIDIAIGTHRLLSQDLKFGRLGLLIIDEEQRFGVAQKERLKQWRKEVHILALSATPLPRTLQLSLAGIRDLSLLETPPRDRLAVETAVLPISSEAIREAIRFELERGGQVFYVYNRVATIDHRARELQELVPELRLAVVHGQLPETELARRMHAFRKGELNCLVASSIVENGLDIAAANTLIVERADRFGLGELYQLRGRVGRGRQLGYCYLLVDSWRGLSEDARRRLEALQEFTQLGSGFRIAGRDLEIRGAGNLLGAEQSGHIVAVGIETYLKLLREAVAELRGERVEEALPVQLDLPVPRAIPHDYVGEERLRLELYRRMASGQEDRAALLQELADRFGPVPGEVHRLLDLVELKTLAESVRVQAITLVGGQLRLQLRQDARVDPERLVGLLARSGDLSFSPQGVLFRELLSGEDPIRVARGWLEEIRRS